MGIKRITLYVSQYSMVVQIDAKYKTALATNGIKQKGLALNSPTVTRKLQKQCSCELFFKKNGFWSGEILEVLVTGHCFWSLDSYCMRKVRHCRMFMKSSILWKSFVIMPQNYNQFLYWKCVLVSKNNFFLVQDDKQKVGVLWDAQMLFVFGKNFFEDIRCQYYNFHMYIYCV